MTRKNWKAAFIAAASSFLGKELVQKLDAKGVLDKMEEFHLLPRKIPGGARGLNVIVAALKELGVEQIPNANARAFLDSVIEEGERRYRPVQQIEERTEKIRSTRYTTTTKQVVTDPGDEFMQQAILSDPTLMPKVRKYAHAGSGNQDLRIRVQRAISTLIVDYQYGMKPGSSLDNLIRHGFEEPYTWQEGMVCFHIDELVEMVLQVYFDWSEAMLEYVGRSYFYGLFHLMEAMEDDPNGKAEWKLATEKLRGSKFPPVDRSKYKITDDQINQIRDDLAARFSEWTSGDFVVLPAEGGLQIMVDIVEECGQDEENQQRLCTRIMLRMHDKLTSHFGEEIDSRDIDERIDEAIESAEQMDDETRESFEKITTFVTEQASEDMKK